MIFKVLVDATQANTSQATYTVPSGKRWIIKRVNVNNIHASSNANLTLRFNGNTKVNARPVENKKNIAMVYEYVLEAGQSVQITSSVASALNVDVIGIEEDVA